ncbi:serine hydrolase [Bacillus shivajii]|uniref:serine hydrolase domain-containing protein n=1 Tax=Bacillus shivajii TaxID=1983719 RepID=UPI001CFBD13E|nr:serine hydrolase domain-containing protein [Bacillus shivajii]UCZ54948.1 serine hydrolase [Bacillus shivajii]
MMNKIEERIDAIFSKWQEGVCPGGQVAVRQKGELIYKKNFGYANIEHEIPVKDETVFHVASVSKQVTVMCVLLLQEDEKLNIDDDVRKYVGEYINFEEPVTIRQMMNNVSGIRDQWELLGLSGVRIVDTITQRDALSLIGKQTHLNFEPQSQFLYSNSNFTLLAEIVERLSGKTLNEFATERIFQPLGMESTFFKDNYWKVIPHKAKSYHDDGTSNFVYSVLNYGTYGATSLNTTASDFLKWLENYHSPKICSDETLTLMAENPTLTDGKECSYAGGLFVGKYNGHKYIEHGGADAAYRSAVMHFTEDDVDIVIFSNTQNMLMKDASLAVADVVFEHDKEKQSDECPKEYTEEVNLEDLAGFYFPQSDAMFMTFDITLKDGQLHLRNPYGEAPLKHISGNHFNIEHLNFDLYLGENSVLKTKDKLVPLKKLNAFQSPESSIYQGRYESSELDTTYEVVEKDGVLHLSHSRNGDQPLYEIEEDTFVTNIFFPYKVEFKKKNGVVTGFTFTGSRVKNIELVKSKK